MRIHRWLLDMLAITKTCLKVGIILFDIWLGLLDWNGCLSPSEWSIGWSGYQTMGMQPSSTWIRVTQWSCANWLVEKDIIPANKGSAKEGVDHLLAMCCLIILGSKWIFSLTRILVQWMIGVLIPRLMEFESLYLEIQFDKWLMSIWQICLTSAYCKPLDWLVEPFDVGDKWWPSSDSLII